MVTTSSTKRYCYMQVKITHKITTLFLLFRSTQHDPKTRCIFIGPCQIKLDPYIKSSIRVYNSLKLKTLNTTSFL